MNECILFSKIWNNGLYTSIKYTKDNNDNKIGTQKRKKRKEIHIVNLRYQSITSNCIRNHWKENELKLKLIYWARDSKKKKSTYLELDLSKSSSGYLRRYCCRHRNLNPKKKKKKNVRIRKVWCSNMLLKRIINVGEMVDWNRDLRELLKGVNDRVDLRDHNRKPLEQYGGYDLLRRRRWLLRAEPTRFRQRR